MNSVELGRLQAIVNEYKKHDEMFLVRDFMDRQMSVHFDWLKDKWPGYVFSITDNGKDIPMVYILLNTINDFKALLFDIRFFIKAGAPHAMHVTTTSTKYSIRQYFGDIDKKILIWEITNNEFKCKEDRAIKVYMPTESLLEILDDDFFGESGMGNGDVVFLSYGPNFDKNTDDFKYPDYILDAISRYDVAMTPKRDKLL